MIVFIILLEIALMLIYFLTEPLYFKLSLLVFFLYFVMKYWASDDEFTGNRTWSLMRGLGPNVAGAHWGNRMAVHSNKNPQLFVVLGNHTNWTLMDVFGFRARHLFPSNHGDLCYLLPAILFRVPIVRDVLLWSGAVSDQVDKLTLFRRGKTVAFSPGGMSGTMQVDATLLAYCMEHNIHVVPVLISGESKCYYMVRGPWVERAQQWCAPRIGWPFPMICWPRRGQRVNVYIGTPMNGALHASGEDFAVAFQNQFAHILE